MTIEEIKSQIATVMQTNGMLGLIDKYRNNDKITLKEIQNEWSGMYSLEGNQHVFMNQYQYTTSLLVYLVMPNEKLFKEIPSLRISKLSSKWGISSKGDHTLRYFIRRIRNSIVHSNINISENMIFSFTDVNPKDSNDVFNCTLEEYELRNFVHAFANYIMTKQI
jgi:hypothetical protein